MFLALLIAPNTLYLMILDRLGVIGLMQSCEETPATVECILTPFEAYA